MNARRAAHHCQKDGVSIPGITFCHKLTFKLIHNTLDGDETESVAVGPEFHPRLAHHKLRKIQNYRGKWNGRSWKKVKTKYGERVRTYCKCNKTTIRCQECYADHLIYMEYYFTCSTDISDYFCLNLASLQMTIPYERNGCFRYFDIKIGSSEVDSSNKTLRNIIKIVFK